MATKAKTTVPPVIKVGGSEGAAAAAATPKTKRSEVVHKSSKDAASLYQVLAKTEETIQELTRMFAECEDSRHLGTRGLPRLTTKQEAIKKELEEARRRYDAVLRMMEL